jgi:beta-lactamase class A
MIDSGFILAAARAGGLGDPAVVLEPLPGTTGPRARLEPVRAFTPASMIKVPIAAALAALCTRGERSLDEAVRVSPLDVTANDAPSPFVAGYEGTLAEAARAMIVASDNVATNVLIEALGRERIGEVCRAEFGLADTVVRRKLSGALPLIDDPAATGRNAHPPADAAALFAAIDRERAGRFGWLYDALLAQIWNDKVPRGLRPGDVFAHKTGDTDDASHDGGVLELADGRRYVLVIYTDLPSSPESDGRIAAFTRTLRDALGDERTAIATGPASP